MSVELEIFEQFEEWNRALESGDPARVAGLYAEEAVLLPTLSDSVRTTPEQIRDYFVHFLSRRPSGRIDRSHVRLFDDLAINSGVYTFRFMAGGEARARFTFVYRRIGDRWRIVEHHSSLMPETVAGGDDVDHSRSPV
jgi:uncharacterized protein (TIGR02246 family)